MSGNRSQSPAPRWTGVPDGFNYAQTRYGAHRCEHQLKLLHRNVIRDPANDAKRRRPLTAIIVIAIALFLGVGLVMSQLARLRTWLGKPPPKDPPDTAQG